ncbi:hypothetical protein WJX79_004401 [Trebouxia sp. C0005]
METEDGNEDVCGACTDIGDLICCESCPAAYHADCAGYVNPQEVPAGDWYCWSCCIQLKRGFPFPSIRFRQEPGSIVYVAIEGRLDTFLRATLEQLGPDNCTVLYNEKRDHATRNKREQLGRRNHRLWHGTADPKAWERGLARAAAPVKRVRSRSRSTPPIVQSAYTAPPALHLPPVGVPVRPTANPSRAPSAAPRSILVGTTIMGPVMYRPHAPVMPSFPANPSQPQAQPPSRLSHPAPAASSHSQSRAKKRAPKKRRHSKIPSSEEEESSLASGETDTDDPNSDTQDSDFGGSGSVAHVKQQKAGKANAGSAAAATSGAVSKEEEEQFLKALTKFWQGQGSVGRKMLAKYQPFESIRLTSGMPPFSAYHFWAAVMALGGHSVAVEWKAWAAVGRLFSAPRSMTTVSHTFKTAYEKLLLPFEEATKKGETGVAVPPVTGRLPPMVKGRHPVQPSTSQGGHTGPSSSGASLQSQSFSDESSDSEAPRDRQKYLRVMTESRGRVRDYGESPRKRARLAVEGFTWGCPSMPSAAELADTDRILVAAESVMSQQAADLAPGTAVEYRSREAYLIGGWFRATIRQVEAGSAAEGGRRFLLDCTDFDGDRDNQSNLQEWVPLVYPDANSAVPYVMIRLPLQPERPPAPDHAWKKGDRVEGFWQNAWWTSTVKDIEEDGTVVCLSDATPVYPEGEEWEVERENLRAGHPQEALAFGMLNLANAPAALPQSAWRAKIKARKFRVDGFTIEAFACQLHLGDTTAVLPEEEEDPGKHARPRTDPTDRHSPSPGTTSGTTQSVPGGSSPDQPPIQATDGGQDRAQQKVAPPAELNHGLATYRHLSHMGPCFPPSLDHMLSTSAKSPVPFPLLMMRHSSSSTSSPTRRHALLHKHAANSHMLLCNGPFILWVDGQLKQRGQTEKRAALRQFIQASRDSSSPPEASKQLFALIGHDMIREWQAALRAGQIQGNGMHPLAASQHSSVPLQSGPSTVPPAVSAVSTLRTQSCPPSVNGGNEGSWASTPQVSVVQGVHQAHGSQSDGLFVPLTMHMNGSASVMQHATSVLLATNNTYQGLCKQHGTGVNSAHMQEAAIVSKPQSSSGVHIVDVTESSDAGTQPVPGTDEGLPFPAFELP